MRMAMAPWRTITRACPLQARDPRKSLDKQPTPRRREGTRHRRGSSTHDDGAARDGRLQGTRVSALQEPPELLLKVEWSSALPGLALPCRLLVRRQERATGGSLAIWRRTWNLHATHAHAHTHTCARTHLSVPPFPACRPRSPCRAGAHQSPPSRGPRWRRCRRQARTSPSSSPPAPS